MLHGSQQHCTEKTIGGRVIHNIDVLDIEGQWFSGLVKGLAESAVLEWFLFPKLGVDGWSDAGSAVGDFAGDVGEYSESLYEEHIEGTFVDKKILKPVRNFFRDINPF